MLRFLSRLNTRVFSSIVCGPGGAKLPVPVRISVLVIVPIRCLKPSRVRPNACRPRLGQARSPRARWGLDSIGYGTSIRMSTRTEGRTRLRSIFSSRRNRVSTGRFGVGIGNIGTGTEAIARVHSMRSSGRSSGNTRSIDIGTSSGTSTGGIVHVQ